MKQYFEGSYFKHQNNGKTLAVIPGKSMEEAFVHVVTDTEAYFITYPLVDYQKEAVLTIGNNIFSESGITLDIDRPELKLVGEINYGELTSINGDIMGPFKFFPMECPHGTRSTRHHL